MPAKLPAVMFYPGDWLRDHVALCSLSAQGLWLRMLILMHDCERYGYLAINGSAIPSESIARKCGCTLEQYETLLAELFVHGVPSMSQDGTIYSRRMVRDAEKRAGANQRLKRFRNAHETQTKQTRHIEDEDEVEEQGEIEGIYAAYPLKKAKPEALKAIKRALRKVKADFLLERTKAYAKARDGDLSFVPNPATWFNQERYNDAPSTWKPNNNGTHSRSNTESRRNVGTANEGRSSQYAGVGKIPSVRDAGGQTA